MDTISGDSPARAAIAAGVESPQAAAPASLAAGAASATPRKPSRLRRWVWRIARIGILVYLGVMLAIAMLQDSLLFPGHSSQGQSYAVIRPTLDSELVTLRSSTGEQIVIYFARALEPDGLSPRSDTASRPTVLFFYGNAMTLSDTIGLMRDWRKMGANTIGVEYPGYGMSSGKPGEQQFYAAADSAYDWLVARSDIDRTKLISAGLSLGTGVAVDLASRRQVAAVALFAPYTSIDELAHRILPWFPSSIILRHHFRSDEKIVGLTVPILIVHGQHDSIIPIEMSARLAEAARRAPVRRLVVDSDHNDLFEIAERQTSEEMQKLIEQVNSADKPR